MVDMFTSEQGKRLFGFIGAAATLGGICGAVITASAVKSVGVPSLLICAAVLIEVGVFAARHLGRLTQGVDTAAPADQPLPARDAPIGGSVFAGLTHALHDPYLLQIGVYMLLYTILSTFLYFKQAAIVDRTFTDRAARVAFFARIDLIVSVLTLVTQVLFTGRVMKRAGVAQTLTFVPALTAAGFLLVGFMPVPAIVIGFIVLRRTGNFAFARPTREVLFTVLSPEDKYKTKNFLDTVVYRLGDQVGAWSSTLVGLGTGAIQWTAVPLALAWVGNAWWLGRKQEKKADTMPQHLRGAQ
jgi:AAA family ATP:ADP antiporter